MKTGVVWGNVQVVTGDKHRLYGFMLGAVFLLLAVAQLFTFEDFPAQLGRLWETSGIVGQNLLAATIVTTEVFALPALIGMSLSQDMLRFSRVSAAIATGLWVVVATWQLLVNNDTNVGLLGATVPMSNATAFVSALVFAVATGLWLRTKR